MDGVCAFAKPDPIREPFAGPLAPWTVGTNSMGEVVIFDACGVPFAKVYGDPLTARADAARIVAGAEALAKIDRLTAEVRAMPVRERVETADERNRRIVTTAHPMAMATSLAGGSKWFVRAPKGDSWQALSGFHPTEAEAWEDAALLVWSERQAEGGAR